MSVEITLSSGQTFTSAGDACQDVRQAVLNQFGLPLGTCDGGDLIVEQGSLLRYLDPSSGAVIPVDYTVSSLVVLPDPPMQWGSVPHLLQASLVVSCVFALVMGIRAGDRL